MLRYWYVMLTISSTRFCDIVDERNSILDHKGHARICAKLMMNKSTNTKEERKGNKKNKTRSTDRDRHVVVRSRAELRRKLVTIPRAIVCARNRAGTTYTNRSINEETVGCRGAMKANMLSVRSAANIAERTRCGFDSRGRPPSRPGLRP